jgi:hypothetical protein
LEITLRFRKLAVLITKTPARMQPIAPAVTELSCLISPGRNKKFIIKINKIVDIYD